jgi:hypothetical protein
MTTNRIKHRSVGTTVVLAVFALAASAIAQPVYATEGMGDLGLQLRLVETVPGKGPAGPTMTGVARIEVLVEAFRATDGVALRVVRPDGSAWTVKTRPFTSADLAWSDPGGEPLEPDADGPSIPARGAIRTTIAVPLEGAAIHEIVVTVTGLVGGEPIATEGVVRAVFGVPDNQPVDDGIHANFSLKEVK